MWVRDMDEGGEWGNPKMPPMSLTSSLNWGRGTHMAAFHSGGEENKEANAVGGDFVEGLVVEPLVVNLMGKPSGFEAKDEWMDLNKGGISFEVGEAGVVGGGTEAGVPLLPRLQARRWPNGARVGRRIDVLTAALGDVRAGR